MKPVKELNIWFKLPKSDMCKMWCKEYHNWKNQEIL